MPSQGHRRDVRPEAQAPVRDEIPAEELDPHGNAYHRARLCGDAAGPPGEPSPAFGDDPGEVLRWLHDPLEDLRERFARVVGEDVDGVELRADPPAATRADDEGARAFAEGEAVSFAAGQLRPGTPEGDRLLLHEWAHVIQQRRGVVGVQRDGDVGAAERQADHVADAVLRDAPPGSVSVGPAPASLQRDPPPGAPQQPPAPAARYFTPSSTHPQALADQAADIGRRVVAQRYAGAYVLTDQLYVHPAGGSPTAVRFTHAPPHYAPGFYSWNLNNRLLRLGENTATPGRVAAEDAGSASALRNPSQWSAIGADLIPSGDRDFVVFAISGAEPVAGTPSTETAPRANDPATAQLPRHDASSAAATPTRGLRPALAAHLTGPTAAVAGTGGTYRMALDLQAADMTEHALEESRQLRRATYRWEVVDVTRDVRGGGRRTDAAAAVRDSPLVRAGDRRGRVVGEQDGNRADNRRAARDVGRDTGNAATDLADASRVRGGRDPMQERSRADQNLVSVLLTPVSAIAAVGRQAVRGAGAMLGGRSDEREIPWDLPAGAYVVRCLVQPRRQDGTPARASSVAVQVVEVRTPVAQARGELGAAGEAGRRLREQMAAEDAVAEAGGSAVDADARGSQQVRLRAYDALDHGRASEVLSTSLAAQEDRLGRMPADHPERAALTAEITSLRERRRLLADPTRTAGAGSSRPHAVIVDAETGETTSLVLDLGVPTMSGTAGWRVRLNDVTTQNSRCYDGASATGALDAARDGFRQLAADNGYGRGSMTVRLRRADAPWLPGTADPVEWQLRSEPRDGALRRARTQDLVSVLTVGALAVPGLGAAAGVLGAATSAERLWDRSQQRSLRLDAESVTDAIALLGAVAGGVSRLGRLSVATQGSGFRVLGTVGRGAGAVERAADPVAFVIGAVETARQLEEIDRAEQNGLSADIARRRRAQLVAGAIRDGTLQFHNRGTDAPEDPATGRTPARGDAGPPDERTATPRAPGPNDGLRPPGERTAIPPEPTARPGRHTSESEQEQHEIARYQRLLPGNVAGLPRDLQVVPDRTPGRLPDNVMRRSEVSAYLRMIASLRQEPHGQEIILAHERSGERIRMREGEGHVYIRGQGTNVDPTLIPTAHGRANMASHEGDHLIRRSQAPDPMSLSEPAYLAASYRHEALAQARLLERHRAVETLRGRTPSTHDEVGAQEYYQAYNQAHGREIARGRSEVDSQNAGIDAGIEALVRLWPQVQTAGDAASGPATYEQYYRRGWREARGLDPDTGRAPTTVRTTVPSPPRRAGPGPTPAPAPNEANPRARADQVIAELVALPDVNALRNQLLDEARAIRADRPAATSAAETAGLHRRIDTIRARMGALTETPSPADLAALGRMSRRAEAVEQRIIAGAGANVPTIPAGEARLLLARVREARRQLDEVANLPRDQRGARETAVANAAAEVQALEQRVHGRAPALTGADRFGQVWADRVAGARHREYAKHTHAIRGRWTPERLAERTLGGTPGQYLPGTNVATLEATALANGTPFERTPAVGNQHGQVYLMYEHSETVGYDVGVPTRWMRVEINAIDEYHAGPRLRSNMED